LGEDLPERDLTFTSDHALFLDRVLIDAGALQNDTTIRALDRWETGPSYTVCHIQTHVHDIIFAEGAAAETFVDNVSRQAFDNFAECEALYGAEPEMLELPHPRASQRFRSQ